MFPHSRLSIRTQITFLAGFLLLGIIAVAAVGWQTVDRLKVNGPVYRNIVMDKDLLADILPPPEKGRVQTLHSKPPSVFTGESFQLVDEENVAPFDLTDDIDRLDVGGARALLGHHAKARAEDIGGAFLDRLKGRP